MTKASVSLAVLDGVSIDDTSVEPIYFQIKEQIRKQITDGVLVAGDPLPSDHEFSRHLGVSRMTVRQAMQELVYLGLAERHRGKGTFVATPKISQRLLQVTSFAKSMKEMGYQSSTGVVAAERARAPKDVAEALGTGVGQDVVKLRRLRSIDQTPLSLQTSYLPLPAAEPILAHKDELATRSLYELLEAYCSLTPSKTAESIEIRRLTKQDASLLGVQDGDPAFFIEAVVTDEDGLAIEFVRAQYRGDLFKFFIEMSVQE